ncbi:extracellular superoxide dismutase [Lampris incognitus]|uniref:extracellular superoxide dismutase n=1 Tax=Lampris incognitus TaxID=2546036 RepID=UPI0024B49BCE|nr:extracellular superoxide dismutase [Lampris incognitus]
MFLFMCLLFALITSETKGSVLPLDAPTEVIDYNNTFYATCEMKPSTSLLQGPPHIYGQVLFKQLYPDGQLQVLVNLRGLPARESVMRAIHIHQFGDLSKGCGTAGPHFNPSGQHHANHPGDLGNFGSSHGQICMLVRAKATLFGAQSVLGRSVVLHDGEDDMGRGGDEESLRSGNAGPRIACCIVGVSSSSLWENTLGPGSENPTEE